MFLLMGFHRLMNSLHIPGIFISFASFSPMAVVLVTAAFSMMLYAFFAGICSFAVR